MKFIFEVYQKYKVLRKKKINLSPLQFNQKKLDADIVEAFVNNAVSFRIIEDRSFRQIFTNFSEPVVLMNLESLSERILSDYSKYNDFIKTKLAYVKYICTTADIWSSKSRNFLGVTGCH